MIYQSQDGVLIGLVEQVGKLEKLVAELQKKQQEAEKRQQETEKRQQAAERQLKAYKSSLDLAEMEVKKQRTAAVPYTPGPFIGTSPAVPYTPGTFVGTSPVLSPLLQRSDKKKRVKDIELPEFTDGGLTDHELRKSLFDMKDPAVREARKDHNRLFEHLLWTHYKSKDILKVIKLPPIAGASKNQLEAYRSREGGPYMEWDMVTSCILIAKDYFKDHFLDNRETRKKLQSLLDNFQNRLYGKGRKTVNMTPPAPDLVAHQDQHAPTHQQPGPSMQVIRDNSMSLTLNTTAERSDSSFDVTPSHPADSYLDDVRSYSYDQDYSYS